MILVQLVTCLDQRLVNKLNPLADRLAGSFTSVGDLERGSVTRSKLDPRSSRSGSADGEDPLLSVE